MSQRVLDSETMAVFCRLINLYDDVTIDNVQSHPTGEASIMLRITEITSIARLAYHASDACIEFLIWPVGHNGPTPDGLADSTSRGDWSETEWASRIQYQLHASPPSSKDSNLSIVIFCVCMAEELVSLKRLAREEADQIRAGWGY